MYVGFLIVGPIYDHYGGQWTLIIASILTFLGYGGMFAAYTRAWGGLSLLTVLYALAGIASTAGYLAALATNMANFSDASCGTVSGVLLAFFGLSATLFSQIKTRLFSGENELVDLGEVFRGTIATQAFLMFLTIVTTTVYIIAAIFMVKVRKVTKEDSGKFDPSYEDSANGFQIEGISRSSTIAPTADGESNVLEYSASKSTEKNDLFPTGHDEPAKYNPFLIPVEMRPKQVVVSAAFWFFVLAQLLQQGFSYINNIDSIVEAVLDPAHPSSPSKAVALTGLHITLISVGNCAGRLASGILSDWAIHRFLVSRSIFFLFSEVLILVPLAMMSRQVSLPVLILNSCLVGATYGATGALFASMTRDFFGVQYYGTNSGLVMLLNGLNPIVANQIYGIFYDRASIANVASSALRDRGQQKCFGQACYVPGFRISLFLQVVCVVFAACLFCVHMRQGKRMIGLAVVT
ncbi:hypothetical protein BGZ93_001882 [Podila epicladia]|nr:hypothetical protein BGZ93_001882 [Podila epicladia]